MEWNKYIYHHHYTTAQNTTNKTNNIYNPHVSKELIPLCQTNNYQPQSEDGQQVRSAGDTKLNTELLILVLAVRIVIILNDELSVVTVEC